MTRGTYSEHAMWSSRGMAADRAPALVKICGIQEAAHGLAAADAGADFIGIVFVPGRRRKLTEDVALSTLSEIREQVTQPPKVVGLFADQPLKEVEHLVLRCSLDMVQLCGGESLDYCGQVGVPVIKVVHVSDSAAVEDSVALLSQQMLALREAGQLVSMDRKVEGLEGGTGQSFNWDIAKALSAKGFPFLLAGGLTPGNVGLAMQRVRPWGVDVSSGVETDGVKDVDKIRAFIQAARSASPIEADKRE